MEKDNLPKKEEISDEELEQVSGGMTKTDLTTLNCIKLTTSTPLSVDLLNIDTTILKI